MKLTFPLNKVVTFLHELYFNAYKESLNFVCFIESVFILRKCSMIFKKNLLSTVSFYPISRQTIKEKRYLCKWNLSEFIRQKNKEWGQVSMPGRLLSLQENKRTA